MRRSLAAFAAALLAFGLVCPSGIAAQAQPARGGPVGPLSPRLVASFPTGYEFGSFAESLAVARNGDLYATVTIWKAEGWDVGQLWRIRPDGTMTKLGADLDVGVLSGLAFDDAGNLYAGLVTFDIDGVPSGVLRFEPDGTATRVVTLPPGSFPNGLAFHGGYLYLSDSWWGAVWQARVGAAAPVTLTTPWVQDPSLAATGDLGVNGIAFLGNVLYAVNADAGSVIRVPLSAGRLPGSPTVVVADASLVGADGVAFDEQGGLWIAVNHGDMEVGGALARVDRAGSVTTVASDPGWLDYPAQPAFGVMGQSRSTLYVVNGSLNTGNCNLIALEVPVRGQPIP